MTMVMSTFFDGVMAVLVSMSMGVESKVGRGCDGNIRGQ